MFESLNIPPVSDEDPGNHDNVHGRTDSSMTLSILDDSSSKHCLGLGAAFRKQVPGPEIDLIDWFLEQQPIRVPRGCRGTIFREPRLESGFPDLVAVIWHINTARQWSPERASLTPADVRVLHHLAHRGPCTEGDLSVLFTDRLRSRLERLEMANTVRRTKTHWHARPLSQTFAVRQIIAFEAKLSKWSAVLEQAYLNTWFASESYVLIPKLPRSSSFEQSARSRGIGIWTKQHGKVSSAAGEANATPRSYASWLFNEWVWRAQHSVMEIQ